MGVGQGENGEERESQFAELAEATAVSDPVATVVMRLFAPPAVTDDRIAQTYGTLADELFRPCRHPVKCEVAMICRKWDNENRYCLKGSPAERNLARDLRSERAFFLPPAKTPQLKEERITQQLSLHLISAIGRLNAGFRY